MIGTSLLVVLTSWTKMIPHRPVSTTPWITCAAPQTICQCGMRAKERPCRGEGLRTQPTSHSISDCSRSWWLVMSGMASPTTYPSDIQATLDFRWIPFLCQPQKRKKSIGLSWEMYGNVMAVTIRQYQDWCNVYQNQQDFTPSTLAPNARAMMEHDSLDPCTVYLVGCTQHGCADESRRTLQIFRS